MFLYAYIAIVGLTWILIVMNVHSVVLQYLKDQNRYRLFSYLGTLLILGSMIMSITYKVIDQVIDSQSTLTASSSLPSEARPRKLVSLKGL